MGETAAYRGEKVRAERPEGVYKSIELTGESKKGWSEAVELCVAEAAETIQSITDVQVEEMRGAIRDGAIYSYRVRCKVVFRIDDKLRSH